MRVCNVPVVWLDWRPGWVVGGWIVSIIVQGKTRPDGIRSFVFNVTWSRRSVQR
jgi:hypothetical protein